MKTTTTEKATARPWTIQEGKTLLHVETANLGDGSPCGMAVCSIPKKRLADAELIVQAVNEHAALKAVAESLEKLLISEFGSIKEARAFMSNNPSQTYWHKAIEHHANLEAVRKLQS